MTAIVWLEGLDKLEKFNDVMRTQTCNFQACSIVPQPSMLPCGPLRNQN
jgi:hypothetical protein